MFRRLRIWLVRRLMPYDSDALFTVGIPFVTEAMDADGVWQCKFQTWNGRRYIFKEVVRHRTLNLRCAICTHEFQGCPDKPGRCPMCDSRDLELI